MIALSIHLDLVCSGDAVNSNILTCWSIYFGDNCIQKIHLGSLSLDIGSKFSFTATCKWSRKMRFWNVYPTIYLLK